jgi:exodeoxyribonuclease VII large subunit
MAEPLLATHNLPEFTVSEISAAVKRTLEGTFDRVRVRGEVSKPNYHGSGHLYFSLKDENAVIDACAWRTTVARLKLRLEHGMEVVVTGRVSSYPGSSKYQIVIDSVELAGEGALLKMLEDRRKRLAAEGLFDAARKKPLPFLPQVIGVITSPTGAVIRDILHRLADRFPRRVILWPVKVQGDDAAAQVVTAIRGFNALPEGGVGTVRVPRPDLLIVARGGGSLEDLMPFNDEEVVRAAAASRIPLISAVGHETDTTLIDFAADRRAPTPTAAAEMAVPVRTELLTETLDHGRRLIGALLRLVEERRIRLEGLARGLGQPQRLIEEMVQRLDVWTERLFNANRGYFGARWDRLAQLSAGLPTPKQQLARAAQTLDHCAANLTQHALALLTGKRHAFERTVSHLRRESIEQRISRGYLQVESLGDLLDSFSYQNVLARGFALVRDIADRPVTTATAVTPGTGLTIQFGDGEVAATAGRHVQKSRPRASKTRDPRQGTLL